MKVLRWSAFFLLGLISLVILALTIVWFNLGLIITSGNIQYLQKEYLPELKVDWSKVNFEVKNNSFWNKQIDLSSEDICINYLNSEFCFESLDLRVTIYPMAKTKFNIDLMVLKDEKIRVALDDFSNDKKTDNPPMQETLNQALSYLKMIQEALPTEYIIQLDNTVLMSGKQNTFVNILFNEKVLQAEVTKENLNIKARLALNPDVQNLKSLDAELNFLSKGIQLDSRLKFVGGSDVIDGSIDYYMKDPKVKFNNLNYKIVFSEDTTKITLSDFRSTFKPYVNFVKVPHCSASLDMKREIVFNCERIVVGPSYSEFDKELSKTSAVIQKTKYYNMVFEFGLKSKFKEAVLLGDRLGEAGNVKVKLKPIKDEFLRADAFLDISILKNEKSFIMQANKTDVDVKIHSFKKLVEILKSSAFAVPAPLNMMSGNLYFNASDVVDRADYTNINFKSKVRLARKPHPKKAMDVIKVDIDGNVDLARSENPSLKTKVKAEVLIKDILLHAPDFDPLRGLPKFTSDSRVLPYALDQRTEKMMKPDDQLEKKPSSIIYDIIVKTKAKDSIKIKYQHFKPHVPLSISARITDKGMSYDVGTSKNWSVEYLERTVTIQAIDLKKSSLTKDYTSLDMNLLYRAAGYKIFINIIGSIEDPVLKLSSDPTLSREDIISVLLYNRTASDLTRFENESVGGAESAISDKAIGLIGMWAFASTPIESFAYDSKSQEYRAQIALPGGVKFDIGTTWERVQDLSLRKRISDSWVFVTSFEPGTEERGGVGNVFLQREWVY